MKLELIKAVVILPGTVLVFVPGAILWLSAGTPGAIALAGPEQPRFWIGIILAVGGFAFAVWTTRRFATAGKGTPAPWAPPTKLVVRGPYRHCRNPMISSALVMLGAEALFFGSWYLAGWMALFFVALKIAFVKFEEPELERRFGDDYLRYKANVPRWIPSQRPWDGS
ncbi:MAG: isoprenylcysteine carboxylmethyltransferase family protein [Rhodospirillaceae bacterium]|nr:isoprenylcysteine carboxylmethyltransferase family protein [Rhodospirillaceae bacterium]